MDKQKTRNDRKKAGKNLLITIFLNLIITAAEVIGGIISNSLALLSDALHNFGDGVAVLIAYIAFRYGAKGSDARKTFGYKRIEILAALLNSLVLTVIGFYLIYEAIQRFIDPEPIKSLPMFIVATIGLIANLVAVFLLKNHSKDNLNIKSAYLHLIGDTFSSVAVIIGGIVIYFTGIFWIDSLITLLISLYILREAFKIISETVNILMQGTPKGLDIQEVANSINAIEKVKGVHHIHIWNLSDKEVHFESHVDLHEDIRISETEQIRIRIENTLKDRYNIHHVTLQMEYDTCDKKNLLATEY